MEERREYKRVILSQPVQFQFKGPAKSLGALSCDISEGGLRVKLNDFIPPETQLLLQINMGPSRVVECLGKVKWVSQIPLMEWYQAGVEFMATDSLFPSRSRIRDFMAGD